jgi:uncharacterized protein (TIGR02301 family)
LTQRLPIAVGAHIACPLELRQCVLSHANGRDATNFSHSFLRFGFGGLAEDQESVSDAMLEVPRPAAHIREAMKIRALVIVTSLIVGAVAANVQASAADTAAPFDAGLARLSEILGSLHYLRGLCGANEGNKWRGEMQALLDAEAPNGQRRSQFIAHFNKGYHAYLETYRTCTPAADLVIRRSLEEGSKIAREVTARYSN